ncbi:MAG: hypothetical protein H0Z32_15870 [Bacillaceae bacterium]|nr:hypothetical protein [Bacillaceae bacterium]
MKLARSIMITLILLLGFSLYFNYQYFQDSKRDKQQYERFVHNFNQTILQSSQLIEELLETNGEGVHSNLSRLVNYLNKTHFLLNDAAVYIEGINSKGITVFQMAAEMLEYGSEYNGTKIDAFISDDKLDEREKRYLAAFQEMLIDIKSRLTDEGNRSYPSKYVFNEALNRYSANDHYSFLDEYLKGED